MKKRQVKILINSVAWVVLLSWLVYMGFIDKNSEPSFGRGQVKGGVYAICILIVLVVGVTVYGVLKSGGGSKDVYKKLRKNFEAFISNVPFNW